MKLIVMDADGLIKMGKAGLLGPMSLGFRLTISSTVYQEAVVNGMAFAYPDAQELDRLINRGAISVSQTGEYLSKVQELSNQRNLHPGELTTLQLFFDQKADALVSDDRAFLRRIVEMKVPFLRVADFIALGARTMTITPNEALAGLHHIKSFITVSSYQQALNSIQKERD